MVNLLVKRNCVSESGLPKGNTVAALTVSAGVGFGDCVWMVRTSRLFGFVKGIHPVSVDRCVSQRTIHLTSSVEMSIPYPVISSYQSSCVSSRGASSKKSGEFPKIIPLWFVVCGDGSDTS